MKVRSIDKYKFFKMIPGLLFVLAGLGGCKKFVTVSQPRNTVTTVDLFSNDVQAASSIAGVYAQMITGGSIFSNGGTTLYTGLSADELNSYLGIAEPASYSYLTNRLNNNDAIADGAFWQPAYKSIYNANAIIEGVIASTSPQLSDSARKQLTGEAKFVRGFSYFYLTNFYGDVPMPLTTDFNKTALLPRSAQADVYTQIIQDMKDAAGLLLPNYNVAAGERIRPNKYAAMAMLARIYLYKQDWTDADSLASAVIASSLFSLPADLTTVFNKNSAESIWQLQPSISISPYGPADISNFIPLLPWYNFGALGAVYLDPSLYSSVAAVVTPGFYLSTELANAFEPNDQRKVVWTGYTPTPNDPPNSNGDTLLWPYKYITETSNVPSTQYYTVLRLAEQYLIRAEAKAEEKDLNGAAADLNVIRARAGLPPTTASSQSDLLSAVAQENRIEFFAEWGHRWFDLKRTGQANTVLGAIPTKKPWNSYELLYPIPQTELHTDPNLVQNPGYF